MADAHQPDLDSARRDAELEREAEVLEARLSRLPSAQPCPLCPSRDAHGALQIFAPSLKRFAAAQSEDDAALFVCRLCSAEWSAPLGP